MGLHGKRPVSRVWFLEEDFGVAVRIGVSKVIHLLGPTWGKRPAAAEYLFLEEDFGAVGRDLLGESLFLEEDFGAMGRDLLGESLFLEEDFGAVGRDQ